MSGQLPPPFEWTPEMVEFHEQWGAGLEEQPVKRSVTGWRLFSVLTAIAVCADIFVISVVLGVYWLTH